MRLKPRLGRVWQGLKVGVLLAVILLFGSIAAEEAATLLILERGVPGIPAPQEAEKPLTYQKLSEDALIFPNREAVQKRREELIRERRDFLFADLNAMSLSFYREGVAARSFPILAKGKEGSFFETPSGSYAIRAKEANHFSSIGRVWMPWSIHFFGNYFIHGWPYYPDGRAVSETFSGGCIRLGTEAAGELFKLARNGMPVLVYSGTAAVHREATYFRKVSSPGKRIPSPAVAARAVLAADFENGQVLFERDKSALYSIASITKLMTALVAVETINRFKILTVDEEALAVPGDSAGLLPGETFKSEDLLYPLLLVSSNDVAALYEREAWRFLDAMNQKARAIGLADTRFADASGISSENVSTAEDLFKLLQYLNSHKKPIFAISGVKQHRLTSANGRKTHLWVNTNWPDDERFIGGKAGTSSHALEVMAAVYRVKFSEEGERPIAVVILGSEDRVRDVRSVIQHLEENFVYGNVFVEKGRKPAPIQTGAAIYEAIGDWK